MLPPEGDREHRQHRCTWHTRSSFILHINPLVVNLGYYLQCKNKENVIKEVVLGLRHCKNSYRKIAYLMSLLSNE